MDETTQTNQRIDSLEKKFNNKFDTLEEKVDNNSNNIINILNTTSKVQKYITELRKTVYSLEKDPRKQLKKLL